MERKKEVGFVNRQGQGGGAKPRLSKEQKQQFRQLLQSQPDFYPLGLLRQLAREHFGVSYGQRQMQRLARQLGMYCYKPQPRDYRQPANAAYKLKEKVRAVADVLGLPGRDLDKLYIGFAAESSPQLHASSARLWCFERGLVKQVNTDKKKRNCFGFYALKGSSVLHFIAKGDQEPDAGGDSGGKCRSTNNRGGVGQSPCPSNPNGAGQGPGVGHSAGEPAGLFS